MKKIRKCEFNMDTACVELVFDDGTMIAIDTIAVENEVANTTNYMCRIYKVFDTQRATGICGVYTRSVSRYIRRIHQNWLPWIEGK